MSDRINMTCPIKEIACPPVPSLLAIGARAFMMNGCRILLSCDPPDMLWHISVSRKDRDPSWDEIATARYRLLPDVEEMGMYLPPLDEYVNVHPFTFHLHEVKRNRIIIP